MTINQDPYAIHGAGADPTQIWPPSGDQFDDTQGLADNSWADPIRPTVPTGQNTAATTVFGGRSGRMPPPPTPSRNVTLRTSFGNHLKADYGKFIPHGLLLGDLVDGRPAFEDERSSGDVIHIWHAYADAFNQPTAATAGEGMPLELLVRDCDEKFCREFLACMESLGFDGAERLLPATTRRLKQQLNRDSYALFESLRDILTPDLWEREPMFKYQPTKATVPVSDGKDVLGGMYVRFLRQLARGALAPGDTGGSMAAYPLERMNDDTWLYLCEDGLVRAKIGRNIAIAPPYSRALTRRGYDLGIPNAVIADQDIGDFRIFKPKRIDQGDPLPPAPDKYASSPRQRLVELAAGVLASRS